MTGSDPLDVFEMFFTFLESVINLLEPSFLSITTIEKLQGYLDGCIIFAANISLNCLVYN